MNDIDQKSWDEWLTSPCTRRLVADLSTELGGEYRACAAAVRRGDGAEHVIAGRIEKLESILTRLKVSHADVPLGFAYEEAGDPVDDGRPDPATVASWQDSTARGS